MDEVDLDEEPEDIAPRPLSELEKKYAEQMRQIFPIKIELPMFTLATQIEQQIDLRPDFQRRDRWTNEKRSRFIESIIMNVPVPAVFLGEEEYGKYVVLDGRQRLTAAYRFLTDQLVLEQLHVWEELNGLTFSQMKSKGLGASIERRFLPAVLLTRESSPEVKYEVFDRLNTGGVHAKPMEVRNAVFPGEFNRKLHELSADPTFRYLWGIPVSNSETDLEQSGLYRDMSDLELVLRFFALHSGTLNGTSFKEKLSDFMSERNKEYAASPGLANEDTSLFRRAVENSRRVFGEGAFRRLDESDGASLGRRSAPYADAIMQALAMVHPEQINDVIAEQIKDSLRSLAINNLQFREAIATGTNGETAIRTRITMARESVAKIIRNSVLNLEEI